MQMPRSARVLLRATALGATYAGIFKLILIGSSFGASAGATFWPASGVTVSVLLLRRRQEWPFYLVAIWLADFAMDTHGAGYKRGLHDLRQTRRAPRGCAQPRRLRHI